MKLREDQKSKPTKRFDAYRLVIFWTSSKIPLTESDAQFTIKRQNLDEWKDRSDRNYGKVLWNGWSQRYC
jgi:hypothetical protein